jgi:pentatricopeptide repeat protein
MILNYTLWSLAVKGHWEVVLPTFYQLVPTTPRLAITPPHTDLAESLPMMSSTQATAQTFSSLIHALAYQGHFDPAMAVFVSMTELGFQPHVPEYLSLFKGFARHGIVPETSAGRLASSFPLWERFDNPAMDNASYSANYAPGRSVSRIWQRTETSESQRPNSSPIATWTESNLREIFSSFLHLSPSAEHSRAPRPEKVWTILMAFARTTNGDEATLVEVWDRLATKFTGEGWWGWALDGRLRRLRDQMESRPEGDELD